MKRFFNTAILVLFVIVLNFAIFNLIPGETGTISNLLGSAKVGGNQAQIQHDEILYGICKGFDAQNNCIPPSFWEKFSTYFVSMITFNFGASEQTGHSITGDLIQSGRLVNTLTLLGSATAVSLLIGIFLGVFVAAKRGSAFDSGLVTVSLTTYSLPTFFMGLIFILIFAQQLGWFPPGGVTPSEWILGLPPIWTQILVRLQHLFLPAMTLTLFFYGGHLLLTRATMTEALTEDYITTARAKGLPERTVLFKHALKNASLPIVTNAALSFGTILSGAIITETIYNWDGLGLWLFKAIGWKDLAVMQAMFYLIALCVIGANLISDIVYGMLDPRIKYE